MKRAASTLTSSGAAIVFKLVVASVSIVSMPIFSERMQIGPNHFLMPGKMDLWDDGPVRSQIQLPRKVKS